MSGSLKVWAKFSVTNKAGKVLNLRMVEMPDNLYEIIVELYIKYFVQEEATFKAAGVPKSEEAMEELRGTLLEGVKGKAFHIVICCLDTDDDTIYNNNIIGASLMALTTKGEPELESIRRLHWRGKNGESFISYTVKSNAFNSNRKKLFEMFHCMMSLYDEAKEFNLDRYFGDRGLFVHLDYRGLGIAQEFLKVRRMICKENGVPINGAWMTSYGTQKAAERDGWETVAEINYEEFGKRYGVVFEKEPPSAKFMIARISCS